MDIKFKCVTNSDDVKVRTLKAYFKDGSILTVDRETTEWEYDEYWGEMTMKWHGCYYWFNDDCVFDGKSGYIMSQGTSVPILNMIMEEDGVTKLEFEIDKDAGEDYYIALKEMTVSTWEL